MREQTGNCTQHGCAQVLRAQWESPSQRLRKGCFNVQDLAKTGKLEEHRPMVVGVGVGVGWKGTTGEVCRESLGSRCFSVIIPVVSLPSAFAKTPNIKKGEHSPCIIYTSIFKVI